MADQSLFERDHQLEKAATCLPLVATSRGYFMWLLCVPTLGTYFTCLLYLPTSL